MVNNNTLIKHRSGSASSGQLIDLKNLVVFAPLAVITVFCLSFVQMKAVSTQNNMKQEASLTKQSLNTASLPLVSQPTLPTLNNSVEIIAPKLVTPSANPYTNNTQKTYKVGPSSIHSGNALQPNSGHVDKNSNNELQATRKTIRLEEAKL